MTDDAVPDTYAEAKEFLSIAIEQVESAIPLGHHAKGEVESACKTKLLNMLMLGAENPVILVAEALLAPIELLEINFTAMEALGLNAVMGLMAGAEQAARREGCSYLYPKEGAL